MLTNPLLVLLRSSLTGVPAKFPPLTSEEWSAVFASAKRQGVAAIVWDGVRLLPSAARPPREVSVKWQFLVEYTEQQNARLNYATLRVLRNLQLDGIDACILKGQATATLYPNPSHRTPGDIDVWLDLGWEGVRDYVRRYFGGAAEESMLHTAVMLPSGIAVEFHNIPAHSNRPRFDDMMKRWFLEQAPRQWAPPIAAELAGDPAELPAVPCPAAAFLGVYLPIHILAHFRTEGVGLKQILDLYWLMRRNPSPFGGDGGAFGGDGGASCGDGGAFGGDGGASCGDGGAFGGCPPPKELVGYVMPMLRALAWIYLQLGMPAECLWVKPDKTLGRRLLDDMLRTGVVGGDKMWELSATGAPLHRRAATFFRRLARGWSYRKLIGPDWYRKPFAQLAYHFPRLFS